jgi:cytidylate kinase
MIITIDGPAGAGKSSTAQALAERLGFEYLDTGAMYRAVTLAGVRAGIELCDQEALTLLLAGLDLKIAAGRVMLQGEDVTVLIRTPEVTAASGAVADSAVVRQHLVKLQRQIAQGRNMVCEGRDQGTLVFPEAACKFFLVAGAAERARRRQREMESRGIHTSFEEVLAAQEARDRRDATRDLAPMVPAAGAFLLDSTHLSLEEVVDRMEHEIRLRHGDR